MTTIYYLRVTATSSYYCAIYLCQPRCA